MDVKIYNIPCYIISPSLWDNIANFDRPSYGEMAKIATRGTEEIYLIMPLHALQIEEAQLPGPAGSSVTVTSRQLSACMNMFLFSVIDKTATSHEQVYQMSDLTRNQKKNTLTKPILFNRG